MSTTPSATAQQLNQQRPFRPTVLNKLRNSFKGVGGGVNGASSGSDSSSGSGSDSDDDATNTATARLDRLPQCWGHRGASAAYPENTLASFKQAILDGAEGIESGANPAGALTPITPTTIGPRVHVLSTDVHVSKDGTIVMFHDAYLNRTTNGKGLISKQAYKNGIDQLITTKLPAQRICTFAETLELLMLEGNRHVVLNVDVKLDNDPEVLYPLMQACIEEFPGWKEDLAPRLILGLWHAKYIEPAQRLLPFCGLAHIGVSPSVARKYFWTACSAFSLNYASLVNKDGQDFVKACKRERKDLYVWTVNDRAEMIQATKWGAKAILTDRTADFLTLRGEMSKDWHAVSKEVGAAHAWSSPWYWTAVDSIYQAWEVFLLHRTAGPMVLPNPLNGDKIVVGGGGSDTTVS